MRKQYISILKEVFYKHLIAARSRLELTQESMASILVMNTRNFVELDHGKSCCSSLTLSLFLIYCCPDPIAFLDELRTAYERSDDNAA